MPESFLQNPLWQFAIKHYQDADVEQALLKLQDNDGCNINLLLWLGFLSANKQSIGIEAFQQVKADLAPLDQVICQLRKYRRQCKGSNNAFYQQLKQQELSLEQLYLAKLFTFDINENISNKVDLGNYHTFFNISSAGIQLLQVLTKKLQD